MPFLKIAAPKFIQGVFPRGNPSNSGAKFLEWLLEGIYVISKAFAP
jgi:hypothetical protein